MFTRIVGATLSALVLSSCTGEEWPEPPPMSVEELTAEHREWSYCPNPILLHSRGPCGDRDRRS